MTTPKILIVDDREENLVVVSSILASSEYHLVTTTSGEDALRLALREDFAVILLDVVMPGMDGFEVARHLKQIERTSRVPIIFLTALATEVREIYAAYAVGAVDYLVKPLDKEVVTKKVAVFVELYRQRLEIARQAELMRDTERREYDLRLAEMRLATDNRYRKLVDGINHAITWSMDPVTRTLSFVSRQAERMLGYSLDEMSAPDFLARHVPPEDRDRVVHAFQKALNERVDQSVDHGFVTASGRRSWFHTGVSAVSQTSARPELHGISIDVTDLKRAEQTEHLIADVVSVLAESFEDGLAMVRFARVIVPRLANWCVIDASGDRGVHQQAAAHADGTKESLIRELGARRQVDPAAPYAVARVLRTGRSELSEIADASMLAGALGVEHSEVVHALGAVSYAIVPLRARGQVFAAMTLVSSESDRRFGASDLAVAEDVCARAALAIDNTHLYQEAQHATLARDEVLGAVSHDLRSPLGVIALSTEGLARMAVANDAQAHKLIEAIQGASERMVHLIDDLLDLERIDSHRLSMDRRRHDATALVVEGLESLAPFATRKSIALEARAESVNHVDVLCDRERILQVFSNLVGNAIKFAPNDSSITVRAERHGDLVLFAVVDEGPGIARDELPHVFDRHWQAKPTAHLGSGLGLAIAKGIIEGHGGRIWAESEPGKGSTFFFTLPAIPSVDDRQAPGAHVT